MSEYNMPEGAHDYQHETGSIEDATEVLTIDALTADIALLVRQRNYLARTARIPARVVHVDYDPAGDTTEYDADKEALELFGESALYFVIGCGPTPTHYSLITKELKP